MIKPIKVTTVFDLEIIEARTCGDVNVDEFEAMLSEIIEKGRRNDIRKILINAYDHRSFPSLIEYFTFILKLPASFIYATCLHPDHPAADVMSFGETVAWNRALSVRHFDSRARALEWLSTAPWPRNPGKFSSGHAVRQNHVFSLR